MWFRLPLAYLSTAFAGSHELTQANYAEVTQGKDIFVKFYAPWCGHCKALAPDWEKLGDELKDHPTVMIVSVDCDNDENSELCGENNVEGFPTMKYGHPDDLQEYEGSRELDDMIQFAKELKPACSLHNIDLCDDEKKKQIEELQALDFESLDAKYKEIKKQVEAIESAFEEEVEGLQNEYEEMESATSSKKGELKKVADLGLAKAVLASKK